MSVLLQRGEIAQQVSGFTLHGACGMDAIFGFDARFVRDSINLCKISAI
jgi:hypothetical protein